MMWGFTDCRHVSEMLWNYTAHRLSEQEVERVERHLTGCGACRAEAEAYRRTVDALSDLRKGPVPDSRRGWRELEARLVSSENSRMSSRSPWTPALTWGAVAAAALVLVVMGRPFGSAPARTDDPGRIADTVPAASAPATVAHDDVNSDPYEAFGGDDATESPVDAAVRPKARVLHSGEPAARRRRWHPSTRIAAADAGTHRVPGSVTHVTKHSQVALNDRHAGNHESEQNAENTTDYVLTPVSTTSDGDSGTEYVMGSVIMSTRSGDMEVANGW